MKQNKAIHDQRKTLFFWRESFFNQIDHNHTGIENDQRNVLDQQSVSKGDKRPNRLRFGKRFIQQEKYNLFLKLTKRCNKPTKESRNHFGEFLFSNLKSTLEIKKKRDFLAKYNSNTQSKNIAIQAAHSIPCFPDLNSIDSSVCFF